jgi:hypothetical protein
MKLPIAIIEFVGIIDMPQYAPIKEVELMAKTEFNMGFIAHPQGFAHRDFECSVLFVDLKNHTK